MKITSATDVPLTISISGEPMTERLIKLKLILVLLSSNLRILRSSMRSALYDFIVFKPLNTSLNLAVMTWAFFIPLFESCLSFFDSRAIGIRTNG